jgi:hypothetical protein
MKFFSGIGEKLRDGLRRSQEFLGTGLQAVLEPERPIDETLWEELEEVLIAADLGAVMAADFVNRGREEVMYGTVTRAGQLRPVFRRFLLDTLGPAKPLALDARPSVVLMLGVNGSGKTTTCAKLAAALKADTCCWPRPTPSGRPPSSSSRRGGGGSTWRSSVRRPGPIRRPSSSTRSRRPPLAAPTSSSSTPPAACTPRAT